MHSFVVPTILLDTLSADRSMSYMRLCAKNGGQRGNRTPDTRIFNPHALLLNPS